MAKDVFFNLRISFIVLLSILACARVVLGSCFVEYTQYHFQFMMWCIKQSNHGGDGVDSFPISVPKNILKGQCKFLKAEIKTFLWYMRCSTHALNNGNNLINLKLTAILQLHLSPINSSIKRKILLKPLVFLAWRFSLLLRIYGIVFIEHSLKTDTYNTEIRKLC